MKKPLSIENASKIEITFMERIKRSFTSQIVSEQFLSKLVGSMKATQRRKKVIAIAKDFLLDQTINIHDAQSLLDEFTRKLALQKNSKADDLERKRVVTLIFLTLEENNSVKNLGVKEWNYFLEEFNPNNRYVPIIYKKLLELYSPNQVFYQAIIDFLGTKGVEKNYLRHYVEALSYIHSSDPSFSASSIRDGVLKFKASIISRGELSSTEYGKLNNTLSLFNHLKNLQYIPRDCVLPPGLPKPANTNKNRVLNPTISNLGIHLTHKNKVLPTADYIEKFRLSLTENLTYVTDTAKELILEAYRFYYHGSDYIGNLNPKQQSIYKKGMSRELVAALQAIIVDEQGINPLSLYNSQVFREGKKSSYINVNIDGSVTVKVIKWRARSLQKRTLGASNLPHPALLNKYKINAAFCFQFALEMRKLTLQYVESNKLWIFITKYGQASTVTGNGDLSFSYFYKLFLQHNKKDIPKVTLFKLRHSRAVEIYLSSGGDILKVANYLGNKVKTALNTYIPLFLQEAIYRHKLSNFQNLYLLLSTASLRNKLEILGLNEDEYAEQIISIFNNPDWGGALFEAITPRAQEPQKRSANEEYFFICSEENFAYAMKVVNAPDLANSEKEIEVCREALLKAGSAPIPIQRLLMKAKNLQKEYK